MAYYGSSYWLRTFLLLSTITGISTLYCLKCSWTSGYVGQDGKDYFCKKDELEEGTIILGQDKQNPHEHPDCTGRIVPSFSNETAYNVIKNMCYPKACSASQGGGVCGRWTFILKGKVVNTTLFCGISQDIGCFNQEVEGGYTKEVCLCNGRDYCNDAVRTNFAELSVLLAGLVCSIFLPMRLR